nr:natural killer cell receptor 2B4-like [Misgurnus anguillicaudatus]
MKKTFLFLLFLFSIGVAVSDTDEVKSVSVNEGDTVTLQTDAELQNDDHILWLFLRKNILLLQFNRLTNKNSLYDSADGRFSDRLNINHQTGDLTITNIKAEHTGLYQVEIINTRNPSYKRFSVTVHAHLPVPVIRSTQCTSSEQLSSSNCSLLCSVLNVTDVSLSWYKGNSLLYSISVSDLNIRLSLPLEVEYQDTNTYSCVVTNSTSNQTQGLNITDDCRPCSGKPSGVSEEKDSPSHLTILISVVVFGLLIVGAVVIFCIYMKFRKTEGLCGADEMKTVIDGVKNITVESFTLDTGVTDIQTTDLIQWKFGELGDRQTHLRKLKKQLYKTNMGYRDW